MSLFSRMAVSLLPVVPRPVVQFVAGRYVAGETQKDAMLAVRRLAEEGAEATLDILGEEVSRRERAVRFTDQYQSLIQFIGRSVESPEVSVKLSMLGLKIEPQFCRENLKQIFKAAGETGCHVTIDMEDHTTTDATLRLHVEMKQGFGNAGTVLQAYMKRTQNDIDNLPAASHIRICKGIYVEPTEIAYTDRQDIRDNFMIAVERLLAGGHYTCIATHDDWLVEQSFELLSRMGVSRENYEFQMLLGVRPELRRQITEAGHRMRVYVPFGADWYPYSMRRLRENPAVAGHVMKAFFRRG